MSEKSGGPVLPDGMTLRDYFAAQALAGMGTWSPGAIHMLSSTDGQKNRAKWAYEQADAMIEARKS